MGTNTDTVGTAGRWSQTVKGMKVWGVNDQGADKTFEVGSESMKC